jgi:hypothetical protein
VSAELGGVVAMEFASKGLEALIEIPLDASNTAPASSPA